MNELKDKVALITGAATGIGRATAELFAREGARLVLADYNADQGEALAAELKQGGTEALFVRTDVSKAADCEHAVKAAVTAYGRLDAAFNNAGISDGPLPPGFIDYPLELWDRMMAVNLSGVFYCMRYQLRAMLETAGGAGCAIVNTASIAGQIAFPGIPGYVAGKHGVVGLTKAAAVEYGGRGIRCNTLAPGFINTPMTAPVFASPQFQGMLPMAVPMGRVAEPDEVAQAALWLCSARSSYVNGTYLSVDGGFLAQ
ncbi:SDR family NAD(P)-dependent oxidoreductase [Pelomonas sp. KK5]|uniref:SDR family NAD(P)-dependent oxidoreductase n=1 Tax=Pelomonas sp. KK5 TaxID=1855730 RepID=UPI00097C3537|nr:SDR family oxidoreductase [Pelomonas sp. KK5]